MQNRLTVVLTALLIALTACGIAFRFINLDTKDFWHDESETALVLSGHTEAEIVDYLSHGPVSFGSLSRFQKIGIDSSVPNMYKVLREDEPGHAPIFYVLEYLFCFLFGTTPMTMRLLTALISAAQLPIIYWLAREIYESKTTALFTTTLASVSPFLIYYAQEARDYSLGLLLMFLSGALLLYALRTNERRAWIGYATTVTIGLYSWLFMVIVVLSHGAFMLVSSWKWKERWLPFLVSAFTAALLFVPWLLHMSGNRENFGRIHDWLQTNVGMVSLIQAWAAIPSKPFALYGDLTKDMEQTSWVLAFLSVASVAAALFLSIKNRKILLPILAACAWIVVFAVPDATSGGMRSVFLRHQTPILANLILIFPSLILLLCLHKRWLVKIVGLFIAAHMLLSETNSSWHLIKSPVWPTKAIRLRYELPVAQAINADPLPALVICQQASTNVGELLGLSHALKADTNLLFLLKDSKSEIPATAKHLYLFNPLPAFEDELALKGYVIRDVANVHHLKTADASASIK
jgi:uncharacterized membrane protein